MELEFSTVQNNAASIEQKVSFNVDGRVVKREQLRGRVVIGADVGPSCVGGERQTVEVGVVERNRCRDQRQAEVVAPGERVVVPTACQRCVRPIVGVGGVLSCSTEGSDDVIFVRRAVAVRNNHPNAGVAVSVGDVGTNLEQFRGRSTHQRGGYDVIGFVHRFETGTQIHHSVHLNGSQTTVVDH